MKFECKIAALKILLQFPQKANVQQTSYEMGNIKKFAAVDIPI